MGNLSKRVSKSVLWEAFLEYGKVVDIFIPRYRNDTSKSNTFAFVRYKFELEMKKTIEHGNNRKVDGWYIRVNKASFGWKDRRNHKLQWRKKPVKIPKNEKGYLAVRDNRSYKKVLLGSGPNVDGMTKLKGIKRDNINNVAMEVPSHPPKKVNYDLDIPKAEIEWLERSAIGYIKVGCSINQTAIYMVVEGFSCQVSPIDCLSALLTFSSKEEMFEMIKDGRVKGWFNDVVP